ncbi:MAG TPA: hypothetical protein VL330_25530, partial [Actinomycetes bacterium]|nr:hypothetical protein [Actinomycetes bacterium]
MGELAMGAVHLAPLLRQLQDLLDLLLQQAVDRATTGGPILKRASDSPGLPAAHPPLGHLQHSAAALHGEPLGDGLVDQLQQRVLGGGCHARRDAADQPQRDFPRSKVSSIACSLTASPSRCISARAAASSASSRACRTPAWSRQRLQRALLGHLADAHDRRPVDPETLGRLALAQLPGRQLQPQLVLLGWAEEPLGSASETIASGIVLGHLHPPA